MDQLANKTRFSVIIIGYNVENYIQRAIESVVNQDFKNIEIIIVDDCSTDNTKERIKQVILNKENIIFEEHIENKKACGARNTRIKNC